MASERHGLFFCPRELTAATKDEAEAEDENEGEKHAGRVSSRFIQSVDSAFVVAWRRLPASSCVALIRAIVAVLSRHLDALHESTDEADAAMATQLVDSAVVVVEALNGPELFWSAYSQSLAQRLMCGNSRSLEAEADVLNKLVGAGEQHEAVSRCRRLIDNAKRSAGTCMR